MTIFKILWGIDALASLVVIIFAFTGLTDGTVTAVNIGLWIIIILILCAILFGSLWLRSHRQPVLAMIIVSLLAVPSILIGLVILYMILTDFTWQ